MSTSRESSSGVARAGLLVLLACLAGCSSTPPLQRAAADAADELVGALASLRTALVPVEADVAHAADEIPVIVNVDARIFSTVAAGLRPPFRPFARGELGAELLDAVGEQLQDFFDDESPVTGLTRTQMSQIGQLTRADIMVISDVREKDGDEYEVVLSAWQLSTGGLLEHGRGDSFGLGDAAVLTLKWACTPFTVLYDIGRRSAQYAFDSEDEDSTILGTVGDFFVAIIYLPVAVFTSDYETTSNWLD